VLGVSGDERDATGGDAGVERAAAEDRQRLLREGLTVIILTEVSARPTRPFENFSDYSN
jgi:hypothetical protein